MIVFSGQFFGHNSLVPILKDQSYFISQYNLSYNHINMMCEKQHPKYSAVILIDCRSSMEFETSHINKSINIGGTRIIRRDILQHKISVISLINSYIKECYNKLISTDDFIVIYDQCSSEPSFHHSQSLVSKIIEDLLRNFKQVYFLQGGFIGFQSKYTNYCWLNKHKLSDEDFVAPSQSISQSNASATNDSNQDHFDKEKSLRKSQKCIAGQLLTRSHTMLTLSARSSQRNDPPPSISLKAENRRSSITKNANISIQQHSLSGPALPFGNQGPTTVLKHLLLGSQKDAMNHSCIQQYKISHVINVSTDGLVCPFVTPQNFLRIPVLDNFTDKITHYFPKAFEFLDNVKILGGRALVHCSAGISRSPTLAIGYLMKTQNISVTEAYNKIKLSRASVSPNFNFMGQLTDYEEELRNNKESKMSPAVSKLTQSRPKRRPSRLGFLSSFLRQTSSKASNFVSSPTSESSLSNNCSLTAQKLNPTLLPSPSVPFAKLGINSPLDEIPSFALKLDNFPSTSLDQLHFQPCQTGPRGVKVKRSAAESGNDSSKIRKCLTMLESYSSNMSTSSSSTSKTIISPVPVHSENSGVTDLQSHSGLTDFQRRHSAVFSPTVSIDTSPSPNKLIDRDHLSTSNRSISYERLNCTEANWVTASATIISDSCRLQECHQSTSSLSSANSHSSNLLV